MSRKYGRKYEDHYFIAKEDDDPDYTNWELCTPAKRLPTCPICEAKTLKDIRRRYRVESDHWAQWVAIDTRQEAKWLAEDGAYDFNAERKEFRITPLWMLRAEEDQMGEWKP